MPRLIIIDIDSLFYWCVDGYILNHQALDYMVLLKDFLLKEDFKL